jgi:hypothetical protein
MYFLTIFLTVVNVVVDSDAWKDQFMIESDSGAVATDDGRCVIW